VSYLGCVLLLPAKFLPTETVSLLLLRPTNEKGYYQELEKYVDPVMTYYAVIRLKLRHLF